MVQDSWHRVLLDVVRRVDGFVFDQDGLMAWVDVLGR